MIMMFMISYVFPTCLHQVIHVDVFLNEKNFVTWFKPWFMRNYKSLFKLNLLLDLFSKLYFANQNLCKKLALQIFLTN